MTLMALFLLAFSDPAVPEIVTRFIAANAANSKLANQYTFVEQTDYFAFEHGQPKKDRSETHEVIFVEGETYKKLVSRNGQPLDAKTQEKERKRLEETATERRRKRHQPLLSKSVNMGGDDELLTLFSCSLEGAELLRGHQSLVLSCVPKPGRSPANDQEKQAMGFSRKYWIDQDSGNQVKNVFTALEHNALLKAGSTLSWEFERLPDGPWLTITGVIEGRLHFAKVIQPQVRTEYRYSNFQKFDVRSTITPDP